MTSTYPFGPLGYYGNSWATLANSPEIGADGTNQCGAVTLNAPACFNAVISSPGAIVQIPRHAWHNRNLTSSSYQMLHEICETRLPEPAEGGTTVGDICHCGGTNIDARNGPAQFGAAAIHHAN